MGIMEKISSKGDSLVIENGLKKYIGKSVYSKEGEKIGKIRDILFKGYHINSIVVSKTIFSKKVIIDSEFLNGFTNEGIILKMNPVTFIIGKQVFDKDGRTVGKVKSVNRKNDLNTFESLGVKGNIFKKQILIYPKDIQIVQKNVILKISIIK